jgi:hypothetical protein
MALLKPLGSRKSFPGILEHSSHATLEQPLISQARELHEIYTF